jgi:endonuclease/exonuclease/phosphatase family metal-dependent hydrolase
MRFRVFNTHLDYANSGVQVRQMDVLSVRLKEMDRRNPLPVILMGDFNAEPDAPVHQVVRDTLLKKRKSFGSLYEGTCRSGLTFHNFHGNAAGFPIDYIYYSRDLIPVSGRIVTDHDENGPWLSDHFPVEARFR